MIIIRKWMIYVAMSSFMILTAPDQYAHEKKMNDIYQNLMNDEMSTGVSSGPNSDFTKVAAGTIPNMTYHDIYLFTYTLHNRRVLTFGALGMVFDVGY